VPRVINLLCDRSLEQAFMAQVRTIDGSIIHSAAAALGIEGPAGSSRPQVVAPPRARPAHETVADIVQRADEAETPASFGVLPESGKPLRSTRTVMLVALAALVGAAALFGMRWSRTPGAEAPSTATPPQAARPAAAQPARVAPAGGAVPPSKEAAAPATAAPKPDAAAAPADATATPFDIIVASFRTEARAASVADQVTALGIAVRRRESDGWQQVVAGPFATRAAAEEAQQRIHGAGLTGTQIAAVAR
jgi:cell division protein FtsN